MRLNHPDHRHITAATAAAFRGPRFRSLLRPLWTLGHVMVDAGTGGLLVWDRLAAGTAHLAAVLCTLACVITAVLCRLLAAALLVGRVVQRVQQTA